MTDVTREPEQLWVLWRNPCSALAIGGGGNHSNTEEVACSLPDSVNLVGELVVGGKQLQVDVAAVLDEAAGELGRHRVVVQTVKDQGGLFEVRHPGVLPRILDESPPDPSRLVVAIMQHFTRAFLLPARKSFFTQQQRPSLEEFESGRKQDQTIDSPIAGSEQRRKVSAHAGPEQAHWFAAHRILRCCQLRGDGHALEVRQVQVGDRQLMSCFGEAPLQVLRLTRLWSGSKTVKVEIAHAKHLCSTLVHPEGVETTRTLEIDGMSCDKCVQHVTRALTGVEGVRIDNVTIGAARVAYDSAQVSDQHVVSALAEAGYDARVTNS